VRLSLTPYGRLAIEPWARSWAHGLEADMPTPRREETEREIAGQLDHRLITAASTRPTSGVAGTGRSRQFGSSVTLLSRSASPG